VIAMITPELVTYIWSERQKGVADYIIKANLRTHGWIDDDFVEAAATLPPAHTKLSGSDIRGLSPKTIWRTPDGEIDVPAKKRRIFYKTIISIIVIATLGFLSFWYRDIAWPKLLDYYHVLQLLYFRTADAVSAFIKAVIPVWDYYVSNL
jgi:hypothetical protein